MDYIDIGSLEYYLRMFFELFFFYALFVNIYANKFNRKKLFLIILFFPVSFIGQIYLEGSAEVLASIFCYWLLKDTASNKYLLLNALALSANIPYLISTAVSSLIINMESLARLSDMEYISVELFYEVLFLLGIIGFFLFHTFQITIN